MEPLFDSGRIADLILVVLAVEAVAIAVWRARGGGARTSPVLPFLLSGAAFALALRAALTDAPWTLVAAAVLVAGVAHAWDLAARLLSK